MQLSRAVLCAAVGLSISGCASSGPNVKSNSPFLTESGPATGDSVTTFFALGDWGTGKPQQMAVGAALKGEVEKLDAERATAPFAVGLGDNVYEVGLQSGWDNPRTLELLETTFEEPYGDIFWDEQPLVFHIVPGNHDYGAGYGTNSRESGWGDVIHQETTAEGIYPGYRYYPLSYAGKPDGNDQEEYDDIMRQAKAGGSVSPLPEPMTRPEVAEIDDIAPFTLIGIDSQAMIERLQEEGDPVNEPSWAVLDSLLAASDKPWKMVLGHHPIKTYSGHGEYATLDNWLWTGTRGKIPELATGPRVTLISMGVFLGALVSPVGWALAGAGLLIAPASVIVDKIHKHPQDTDHWAYNQFGSNLEEILARHDAFYLSGHDHNLQFIELSGRAIQIVSGSAGKQSWVAASASGLHYSAAKPGFVRFDGTAHQLWMQFCTVEVENPVADCGTTFRMVANPGGVASTR